MKLILQPLLENAINYGVSAMDDCGEIRVTGRLEEGNVILTVEDNGIGIPPEEAELLLTDDRRVHKKVGRRACECKQPDPGSFWKAYGLSIESEPDEGTKIVIRIPAVPFTEENRERLEKGGFSGAVQTEKQEIQP